ncbi:MAG: zf-HC2 domain-containing protein, partial [Ruminococcus sp.]|nr:zf-HC2 domain-containing protein [Ruminococcus sp.]
MKCNIVKDLLPLYCDKLTSEDSNEEIEKHLNECADCKAVYESINKKEDDIKLPDKDVNPLKKVKKRTKLKVIAAILGTAALLFGVFMFVFWGVIPISSDKLHYTVEAREVHSYTTKSDELDENGEFIMEQRTDLGDNFYPVPEGVKVKTEHYINFEFEGDCSCTNERSDEKYDYFVNDDGVNDMILHEDLWIYPVVKLP